LALEIERKFLIHGLEWKSAATSCSFLRQGFISIGPEGVVRVRLIDDQGVLTIKGPARGTVRAEYEYEIPARDAAQMLEELCQRPLIEKTRYRVSFGGLLWEVDIFAGENEGLCVAEVELEEEGQQIELPPWVGSEVTGDPRYYNSSLVRNPFSRWRSEKTDR
jgi:adenylate cyclase